MNLLYANPLTLAFHYLSLFIYGTPYTELQSQFAEADRKFGGHVPGPNKAFDFIVVGGGSAGAVVASRLSEEKFSVLLLETGGNPFPLTSVAALPLFNLNNLNIGLRDEVAPQIKASQLFRNNGGVYNRGRVLGGGSTLNFMISMRGNPEDYNRWAKEADDESWSYENMLPYFRKMENYNGDFPDENLHGKDGPLYIEKLPFAPLKEEWLAAGEELGFKTIDPNGYQTDSFFPYVTTTKGGIRYSTHRGYLYPHLQRPNLTIRIYSTVTKIELNSENKAVGVHYEHGGKSHYVAANKEIIVSSGTVGSPQLLMLSGIGPRDHLKSLDIPVKVDLPAVGQNLQDHQISWFGPFTFDQTKIHTPIPELNEGALHEFILNGTGPFSSVGSAGGALASSSVSPGWPDIYVTTLASLLDENFANLLESVFDFKPNSIQKYFKNDYGKYGLFIAVALGLPKTTGQIRLKSKNIGDALHIDPNYFDNEDDIVVMLEGLKMALDIVKTKSFQKIGAKLIDTPLPGCESIKDKESDEYLKCHFKHWTSTMWHYSCTCKMGTSKENSVVDSNLRVFGVKGLRVIDASVMPKVTNTNTNIPTIAIGEKGADMIRKYWTSQSHSSDSKDEL